LSHLFGEKEGGRGFAPKTFLGNDEGLRRKERGSNNVKNLGSKTQNTKGGGGFFFSYHIERKRGGGGELRGLEWLDRRKAAVKGGREMFSLSPSWIRGGGGERGSDWLPDKKRGRRAIPGRKEGGFFTLFGGKTGREAELLAWPGPLDWDGGKPSGRKGKGRDLLNINFLKNPWTGKKKEIL